MKIFNNQNLYLASSFISGFSVMVIELISSRIVAPIIGSSVFTWTSVIGLTLLGLAVGGWSGGRLADKIKSNKLIPLAFLSSAILVSLIPFFAEHTTLITQYTDSILVMNILLSLYLFLLPTCVIGTIQPLLLKKYADDFSRVGSKYGTLSAVWSIGSMFGVFLTGFFLISTIGSKETIWLIAIILFLVGTIFAIKEKILFSIFLLSIIIMPILLYTTQTKISSKILFQKETNYYNIKVVDTNIPLFGQSRLLFLDLDTNSIETKESNTSSTNPYLYPEMYPFFSLIKKDIKNILVIGAGAYTMPKYFKDYYKNADVTVMETDPEIITVGNDYFNLKNYKIKTIIGDARILINKNPEKYDVIFGDAYNSFISVPWYLLTKEWNDNIREKLNDNGIYAVNFIGSVTGDGASFTKSVASTFALSFPNFYVLSFDTDKKATQNIVLIGVKGNLPFTEDELFKKISDSEKNRFLAKKLIPNSLLLDTKATLLTDNFSPVEKLMNPMIKNFFLGSLYFYQENTTN